MLKIDPSVVDAFSGAMLAFGVASALFHQERTGCRQSIEVSMLACASHLLESNLTAYTIKRTLLQRMGNQDNLIAPFGIYKVVDGFIALAIGTEAQWPVLRHLLSDH